MPGDCCLSTLLLENRRSYRPQRGRYSRSCSAITRVRRRKPITPLEGIRSHVSATTEVLYSKGCAVSSSDTSGFAEAVALASRADVVIYVAGLSQQIEGEEGQDEGVAPGERSNGDRVGLNMPGVQEELSKPCSPPGSRWCWC